MHQILTAFLMNLSQYAKQIDGRCVGDRFFSLFNGLLGECQAVPECKATHCTIDAFCVIVNVIINVPQNNHILIGQVLQDSSRIMCFLRGVLDVIDEHHSTQLSAHLSEEDLEFTALLVGILRFLEKLQSFLALTKAPATKESLSTFPVPTIRRDARGEAWLMGVRARLIADSFSPQKWSQYANIHAWTLIYSLISWQEYVQSDR